MTAIALAVGAAASLTDPRLLAPEVVLFLPLIVVANKSAGLYDRDRSVLAKTTLDDMPRLFHVTALSVLLLWLADGPFLPGTLTRSTGLVLGALLFVSLVVARAGARHVLTRFVATEKCLVIGSRTAAERITRKLAASPSTNAVVVGFVEFPCAAEGPVRSLSPNGSTSAPLVVAPLGTRETLGLALVEHDIERVIFATDTSDSEELLDVIRVIRSLGLKVSILARLLEVVGQSTESDEIQGLPLLGLRPPTLTRSSRFLKRSLDLTGAVFGLVVGAPLFAAIALAIKLDSPGPVLFSQRRIGRYGQSFSLLKFRTMVTDADERKADLLELNEADGLFKIANDPRITGVGRWLRRTSLDELPQLLNVLRGEMSLVGPRPLVPHEDGCIDGWNRARLSLMPGMTGHWQVLGSARVPLHEMVKIDHLYAANWSLWLDVKILLRTVAHVLARNGQ